MAGDGFGNGRAVRCQLPSETTHLTVGPRWRDHCHRTHGDIYHYVLVLNEVNDSGKTDLPCPT